MFQTIHATEQELKRIFSDDYFFRIPGYQRPYSWTRDHTATLLDDLIDALPPEGVDILDAAPYFLGSIVLIKDPNFPDADVVDGQQRLATLTLLLAVLRDLSDKSEAEALHKYVCEIGDKFSGSEERYRLQPRPRDRAFFRDQVQQLNAVTLYQPDESELSDSHVNIRENTVYLKEALEKQSPWLRDRLAMFLLQRCFLVVVSASDQASAYRIFSVMNDRGMDLEPTDILKADIIGAIPQDQEQQYTELWEGLEEDLGRDRFADLFGHIRMIHRKAKARQALMQEIRDSLRPQERPQEFIDRTLAPMARAFQTIENTDFSDSDHGPEINRHLVNLNRLDNSDWLPPAISFFARYESHPKVLERFLADLERLAYALFIRRAAVNERIDRYIGVLGAIDQKEDLFKEDSALQLTSQEKREVLKTLQGPLFNQVQIRLPVLMVLEGLFSGEPDSHHYRIVSVEHVLPPSPDPGGEWAQQFPDSGQRKQLVHTLGNLVLIPRTKNRDAQNWDFQRKKTEYLGRNGQTPFALTQQVLGADAWTPQELERRQQRLVSALADAWRLH